MMAFSRLGNERWGPTIEREYPANRGKGIPRSLGSWSDGGNYLTKVGTLRASQGENLPVGNVWQLWGNNATRENSYFF